MKTAAVCRLDAPRGVGRTITSVLLVERLHVDLCRCMSAACCV
ncbi:hypothetical protein AB0L85_26650 [Streptomyces sp. NPDC052051]|nr:hypothetical protein [Streptomyces macrolidinus]